MGMTGARWSRLGNNLPHGLVLDLRYNYKANVLVAGILGRGAWTLNKLFDDDHHPTVLPRELSGPTVDWLGRREKLKALRFARIIALLVVAYTRYPLSSQDRWACQMAAPSGPFRLDGLELSSAQP
jgi:hypothetical protein